MKHLLFFLFWCFLFHTPSFAQFHKYEWGVKGGFNFSSIDGIYSSGFHGPMLNGGFLFTINLSDEYYVLSEVYYTRRGGMHNVPTGIGQERTDVSMTIDFLEVPVLMRQKLFSAGNSSVGLLAGAGVAVPVGNQKLKTDQPVSNSSAYQRLAEREIEAPFDVNLQLGLNAKIVGEKANYFVDFRLARGLMDIFYERSKILSLNVNVGVSFPFDQRD